MAILYDDGRILLDDDGVTLRRFDLLLRDRFIPYSDIARGAERPLGRFGGRLRMWGAVDVWVWLGLDPGRRQKDRMIVLDVAGQRTRVALTPDDHDVVVALLAERVRSGSTAPSG